MSRKKISVRAMKTVIADLGEVFTTKDVSEDPRMVNAHRKLEKHSHYHAFVGGALSDHRGELDIREIQKGTSRGSRWQKSSVSLIGSPKTAQIHDQKPRNSMKSKVAAPVTLVCPSCGGKLETKEDSENLICSHCGNEHIINQDVEPNADQEILDELRTMKDAFISVKQSAEISAAEMSIMSINKELKALRSEMNAFKKKIKSREYPPNIIGGVGFLLIILGIATAFTGCIGVTIASLIIGIPMIIISFVYDSNNNTKIQEYEERIRFLENKRKANLDIIRRGGR